MPSGGMGVSVYCVGSHISKTISAPSVRQTSPAYLSPREQHRLDTTMPSPKLYSRSASSMQRVIIYSIIFQLSILTTAMNVKTSNAAETAESHYEISDKLVSEGKMDEAKLEFMKGVEIDMAKKTVDDILAPVSGEILKVSGSTGRNSYQTLVYDQPGEKEKKPVVVLFYNDESEGSHRNAIIFLNLVRQYGSKVKFVIYNEKVDSNWNNAREVDKKHGSKLSLYGSSVNIALYSSFDVANGETPQKNDGKIKQIDIMRGAPGDDLSVYKIFTAHKKVWVPGNLFYNNSEVYRFNNLEIKEAKSIGIIKEENFISKKI